MFLLDWEAGAILLMEQTWQMAHRGHLTLWVFRSPPHVFFFSAANTFPLVKAKKLKRVES